MSKDKVRINLKAYDHQLLDVAAGKIVESYSIKSSSQI